MTYQSKHILIKDPQEGYDLVSSQYHQYHQHLTDFDKGFFLRLMPKETKNLEVVDLGAGDGRIYTLCAPKFHFHTFVACDISKELLALHPSEHVQKILTDLEDTFPFADEHFDLAFAFFVLEHLKDLDHFFQELYRILKPGGQAILGYFLQRREFVWKAKKDQFKIQLFNYRIQDIQASAEHAFFTVKLHEITEKGYVLGWDMVLQK